MEKNELRKGYTIYEDNDGNTVQIAEDVIASIVANAVKERVILLPPCRERPTG